MKNNNFETASCFFWNVWQIINSGNSMWETPPWERWDILNRMAGRWVVGVMLWFCLLGLNQKTVDVCHSFCLCIRSTKFLVKHLNHHLIIAHISLPVSCQWINSNIFSLNSNSGLISWPNLNSKTALGFEVGSYWTPPHVQCLCDSCSVSFPQINENLNRDPQRGLVFNSVCCCQLLKLLWQSPVLCKQTSLVWPWQAQGHPQITVLLAQCLYKSLLLLRDHLVQLS